MSSKPPRAIPRDAKRILVVDDEPRMIGFIRMNLELEGYQVLEAHTGVQALETIRTQLPDLVLLDVMMPTLDGFETLRMLREFSSIPVIMLTAKGEEDDKVYGLELGADDYMPKPFDAKELLARIKAVLRRLPSVEAERKLAFDGLTVSLENYAVTLDGKPVEMPPKEIELLYFLAAHEGKVFTREQLLEQVWGFDFFGDSRTVDVHVKRIREKLGERAAWQIKTVWGVGYKFEVSQEA